MQYLLEPKITHEERQTEEERGEYTPSVLMSLLFNVSLHEILTHTELVFIFYEQILANKSHLRSTDQRSTTNLQQR